MSDRFTTVPGGRSFRRKKRGRKRKPDHELKHPRQYKVRTINLDDDEEMPDVRSADNREQQDSPTSLSVASTNARSANESRAPVQVATPRTSEWRSSDGSIRRAGFAEAAKIICEPEAKGEGFRHGWLGNTGSGKTTAIARLIHDFPAKKAITLIHDDTKRTAQYESVVVRSFGDAPDDATVITIRGEPMAGILVEPEEVANVCVAIGMAGISVRFVIDELDRACTPGGRDLVGSNVRTTLTRGRALSLSVLWSTQAPQRAPREFIDQSTTIALCQLGPRALNYLDDRLLFDGDLLSVVPTLSVGEFVLYQQGKNWNRTIYY